MKEILEIAGIFAVAFVVGLSGAVMPGPLLAVVIREAPKRGAMVGPLVVLGHAILEALLVVVIACGLAGLLKSEPFMLFINLVGGAMMCFMGQGMIRSAGKTVLISEEKETGASRNAGPVLWGALMSISNPYWLLWWAVVGVGYVLSALNLGIVGVMAFFVGHITSDLVWYSIVGYGMARGRKLIPEKIYHGIIVLCGCALLVFGLWLVFSGLKGF